jgi:hypothetical protein
MTVVLPPARAERDPVSQVSPVGELSCSIWTWESTPLQLLLEVVINPKGRDQLGDSPRSDVCPLRVDDGGIRTSI